MQRVRDENKWIPKARDLRVYRKPFPNDDYSLRVFYSGSAFPGSLSRLLGKLTDTLRWRIMNLMEIDFKGFNKLNNIVIYSYLLGAPDQRSYCDILKA